MSLENWEKCNQEKPAPYVPVVVCWRALARYYMVAYVDDNGAWRCRDNHEKLDSPTSWFEIATPNGMGWR